MPPGKLEKLLSRPVDRPPIVTVTGEQGVGKTTLACLFPFPVVLRFEDGLESIPAERRPYAFPMTRTHAAAMQQVRMLLDEEHPFKTLIVDSVTRFANMVEAEIIEADPKRPASINQALGGYGAGLNACAERHRLFVNACKTLNEQRGMAIIYVAHSVVETVEPPDGEAYTRYTVRMDKRAQAYYLDEPDMVAFVRVKTKQVTTASERVRNLSTQERVIVCHPTGAHVSKNRYNITEAIDWADRNTNPLAPYIPYYASAPRAARRRSAA